MKNATRWKSMLFDNVEPGQVFIARSNTIKQLCMKVVEEPGDGIKVYSVATLKLYGRANDTVELRTAREFQNKSLAVFPNAVLECSAESDDLEWRIEPIPGCIYRQATRTMICAADSRHGYSMIEIETGKIVESQPSTPLIRCDHWKIRVAEVNIDEVDSVLLDFHAAKNTPD